MNYTRRLFTAAFTALAFATPFAHAGEAESLDGTAVSVDDPQRIVAINSSTVGILRELGEAEAIVATDAGAYDESMGEDVANLGHPYRVSAEQALAQSLDLVIGPADVFGDEAVQAVREADAEVQALQLPRSDINGIDGLKTRIQTLAQAFDKPEAGAELIQRIEDEVAELPTPADDQRPSVAFLYPRGDDNSLIYAADRSVAELIHLAGGQYATDADEHQTVTAELMAELQPDAIVVLQRGWDGRDGMDGLLQLPGVADTPAGQNRDIFPVDSSARWIGPDYPQIAAGLAEQLADVEPASD